MSTKGIAESLLPRTRRLVLRELVAGTDAGIHLRELARRTGLDPTGVQRELQNLQASGIITRKRAGKQDHYRLNPQCPVYHELRMLILKTVGLVDVLKRALEPMSNRITVAFIYGSVARREERGSSDVDVLVIGDVSFADVVSALSPTQETLGREVNPSVYPPDEFSKKLADGHHFLKTVMAGEKLFLIGDESELERLGK